MRPIPDSLHSARLHPPGHLREMRVPALLLAMAAPLAAASQLPTSHRGTHVSHLSTHVSHRGVHVSRRATCIVSAQGSPADGTALESTGQMASIITKRLTEKLDEEWGEHEDHARVRYKPEP